MCFIWTKKQPNNPKYDFNKWLCRNDNDFIYVVTQILATIIIIISMFVSVILALAIRENKDYEESYYTSTIVEAESLKSALEVSEDIVNTGLYERIVNYNSELAYIKTCFNSPNFKPTFSGEYDWNSIDYVLLNENN